MAYAIENNIRTYIFLQDNHIRQIKQKYYYLSYSQRTEQSMLFYDSFIYYYGPDNKNSFEYNTKNNIQT